MSKIAVTLTVLGFLLTGCTKNGADFRVLFPVRSGGEYGYIDRTGKIVIDPQFEDAGFFSEGLGGRAAGPEVGVT